MAYFLEIFFATCLAAVVSIFAVVKVIWPKMFDKQIEEIKQFSNRQTKFIEKTYETELEKLKIATELAYRSHEELRSKRIFAVEKLWEEIIRLNRAFVPLMAIEVVLTEQELNRLFRSNGTRNKELNEIFNRYSSFEKIIQILDNNKEDPALTIAFTLGGFPHVQVESRIFVTDKLWDIYDAFVRVHGRFGYLVSKTTTSNSEINWRTDHLIKQTVEKIFSPDVWTEIQTDKLPLHTIIVLLQMEFIAEAQNVFRSLDVFSETTQEFHNMLETVSADVSNIQNMYSNRF